jgi:hypothetical protein
MPLELTSTPYFSIPYLQPLQNDGILYTDRSLKDEQLLIRPFLSKTKKYEHGGRLNVKICILFCGDNS